MARWFSVPLLLVLFVGPADVRAEEATEGRLTLQQLFSGKPLTRSIPAWTWRPGHAELVRVDVRPPPEKRELLPNGKRAPGKRFLLRRDARTGTEDVLLAFETLDALVPGKGVRMRGIGRRGAPSHLWTPDGQGLVVQVKGDLVWVDLKTGTRRRLTQTKKPLADIRISPDGRFVSFTREFDLWSVALREGAPRRLTDGGSETLRNGALDWVYPEELHFRTAAWWAPNGERLAYLQLDETDVPEHRLPKVLGKRGEGRVMRYPRSGDPNPKARVGVVASGGGETTWLDLGAHEYVARVTWTPDGKRVLVATLDRPQRRLRLLACDPVAGGSTLLLEETDPAWVDTPPAPRFEKDGRFLWRSHRDGSTRWYLVALDASRTQVTAQTAVTPPGYDAGSVLHVEPDRKRALFQATQHASSASSVYLGWGDRLPKHAPFVSEPGFTTSAVLDESHELALVTYSDAVTPTRRELWDVRGELIRLIGDARSDKFDALELAVPEELSLPIDGGLLRMRLWKPADLEERRARDPELKLPVIVQVYGGPGSRSVRNAFGRGPLFVSLLTQRGYLVLQIDGRGSGGQGSRFVRRVQGQLGVLEIQDQAQGVKHVAQRAYVDGSRVGIWGWSYGGTMACNALTMQPDVFRVGVAVAPVTDWRLYDTIYTERYMNTPKENPDGYKASSSITHVKAFKGRLLLLHGLGDDNVHAQNTYQLAEALLKAKKSGFDLMTYPWRGHGIQGATLDLYTRLVAYFDRHL